MFRVMVRFSSVCAKPLSVLGALLVSLLLPACEEAKTAPAAEARPVKVSPVVFSEAREPLAFAGTIAARTESAVGFRIAGKVIERSVDSGAHVKAGDVLVRLDPEDYELQKRNAQAQAAAADADLAKAKADAGRYAQLRGSPVFNPATWDQRRSAADAAQARLNQARAQLRIAENQLAYTTLRADADGVVTATNAEPGQVVPAGQWVVKIAHDGEREVLAYVPERRLAELRAGSTLKVVRWAAPDKPLRAAVREIVPQADPVTRTYAVRFALAESDSDIQLGMTATVVLERPFERPVAAIPLTALFQKGTDPALWVVDPRSGGLSLRPVTIAAYREESVLVADGVADGELVVTAGVHKLAADRRVRILGADR